MSKLFSLFVITFFVMACSNNTDKQEEVPSNQIEDSLSTTNTSILEESSIDHQETTKESIAIEQNTSTIAIAKTVAHKTTTTVSTKNTNVSPSILGTNNNKTEEVVIDHNNENIIAKAEINNKPNSIIEEEVVVENKPPRPALSHDIFNELLGKYVTSSGGVDYEGFKTNKAKLAQYLEVLKNNPPESSWSKNKEMAYWINMYNAITISSIVDKYPVNSVMDLEGGKVWDKKKIDIKGESLTLNIIEKEKLLKKFQEPRVHFAVNCAAASCPPLLNKAWEEDNIQRYLDKQAKAFINDKKYNVLSAKTIEVSQIFNWYAADFGGADKIVAFFQKYSDTTINNNAKVSFKEYDWKLNKK